MRAQHLQQTSQQAIASALGTKMLHRLCMSTAHRVLWEAALLQRAQVSSRRQAAQIAQLTMQVKQSAQLMPQLQQASMLHRQATA